MKWVNIGAVEATVFVAIAAAVDPAHRVPILAGGALELAITYAEYLHGRDAGLSSSEPGTETTSTASGGGARRRAGGWSWA